jgi:hypothetical protein
VTVRRPRGQGAGAAERPQEPNSGRLRQGAAHPDVAAILAASKPRKYHNVPTEVDGHRFDSKKEAERYAALVKAERAGEIRDLEIQPRFPLIVHQENCGAYVGDFSYVTRAGEAVVEDVKSAATRKLPTYRLKRRLVWALYGLTIREV